MGRGWELLTGAFLATLRPVAGIQKQEELSIQRFLYRGISFSRANATRCHGARAARKGGRRRGKDLIATRFTTSETVMSAIEQLGEVIKIEKKKLRARTR